MADVTIRHGLTADVPAIGALLDELDDLHRDALPWLLRKVDDASNEYVREFLSKPGHVVLVASSAAGTLAGALLLFLRQPPEVPIVQPATIAEIDTLVVKAAFRRQSVGRGLVAAALEWAIRNEATRTELGVYEFNQEARAFWQSVGFQTLSRRLVAHAARDA